MTATTLIKLRHLESVCTLLKSHQTSHDLYCLVPRRLSSMCAQRKAGRRQRARRRFACRLYPSHGPLRFITSHSFRARLCHAKNEAPEEEAVICIYRVMVKETIHCVTEKNRISRALIGLACAQTKLNSG